MENAEMLTPKEVGKRIKERRNEIGISMPELGRRVGVNKSTVSRTLCRARHRLHHILQYSL